MCVRSSGGLEPVLGVLVTFFVPRVGRASEEWYAKAAGLTAYRVRASYFKCESGCKVCAKRLMNF